MKIRKLEKSLLPSRPLLLAEGKRGVVDAFSRLDLISAARDMYVLCVWGFAIPTQKRIRILSYVHSQGRKRVDM